MSRSFGLLVIALLGAAAQKTGSYKENTHLYLDLEECTGVENCKTGEELKDYSSGHIHIQGV